MPRVYLDHNASTPTRPEVLDAVLPYFRDRYGNASSAHAFGQQAKGALEEARVKVAAFLNAAPSEIVFTSGGTESDNLAVIGGARAMRAKGRHVVVSAIEHDAVRFAADALESEGFDVTRLVVGADGRVEPETVKRALRPDTILVSIMATNNETGIIQPSSEIGRICAAHGIPYHIDAVQAAGKIPLDVRTLNASFLTITGHKFYGLKGAGVLFVRRGQRLEPLQHGGSHERGRRAGTENVPAIVGLGAACALAREDLTSLVPRLAGLRDRMEARIMERIPKVLRHGDPKHRVCNTSHLSFVGVEGEQLLVSLDMKGIALSSGAACKAGSANPSHVLLAMGVPASVAQSAVRFSLGAGTTEADIDRVLDVLPGIVQKLRTSSPTLAS